MALRGGSGSAHFFAWDLTMKKMIKSESAESGYRRLLHLGGVAAWIAAGLILAEAIGLAFYPQPGLIEDWFQLFQANPLIGLLDAWLLELPLYAAFLLIFLALFVALKKEHLDWALLGLALALVGCALFFATNNPFTLLSLSSRHAAATTEVARSQLLATGQALLATTGQRAVGGFNLGLLLVSSAGLVFSLVMLRSPVFSQTTAIWGILANAVSLADYLRQALTDSAIITLLVVLPNMVFLIIWFCLLGCHLSRLGRD
jgi:hypothetical protein